MNLYFKKSPVWKWWNKFSDIRLQVSIDGIGDRGSYIRKGFDSNKFEANLKEVRENAPHVKMAASVTISFPLGPQHTPFKAKFLINSHPNAPQPTIKYFKLPNFSTIGQPNIDANSS